MVPFNFGLSLEYVLELFLLSVLEGPRKQKESHLQAPRTTRIFPFACIIHDVHDFLHLENISERASTLSSILPNLGMVCLVHETRARPAVAPPRS
jgi:hypothetical protein